MLQHIFTIQPTDPDIPVLRVDLENDPASYQLNNLDNGFVALMVLDDIVKPSGSGTGCVSTFGQNIETAPMWATSGLSPERYQSKSSSRISNGNSESLADKAQKAHFTTIDSRFHKLATGQRKGTRPKE